MPSKIFSATIIGLDSQIIEIETDVSYGLKNFNIVGLPDKSIEESKERVSVAIKNSGLISPLSQPQRILINLAPADLKKEGSLYDLPIALGYLLSSKQTKFSSQEKIFVGELSLDGRLKPIKGALAIALTAQKKGFKELILPKINAQEAALIYLNKQINNNDFKILGVESLKEVINYLENRIKIKPTKFENENILKDVSYSFNFDLIKGQESAKRALEIAAAGGHNVFFNGPPGTGKSLLARSLPSILPNLSFQESLEVTKIHSIAGLLPENKPLINTRPFRSPHHSASESALIGGGNPLKPGEITLSHRGVLFLDEFPEFHRDVLESLRQPLEEGEITILRAKERITFPARFILIAAANPCPCGYFRDPNKQCVCQPSQIAKYRRKLSGPLIDRIDIFINVPQLKFEKLTQPEDKNITSQIKEKVEKARKIQKERFSLINKEKILVNAEMGILEIKKYCQIDSQSKTVLKKFVDSGQLSVRGYHRVLKTARTIADLDDSENIKYDHLMEALMYRIKEN